MRKGLLCALRSRAPLPVSLQTALTRSIGVFLTVDQYPYVTGNQPNVIKHLSENAGQWI